jgi:hypothetical protein
MAEAIRSMAIRGAPALGVAAAFAIALEAVRNRQHNNAELRAILIKLQMSSSSHDRRRSIYPGGGADVGIVDDTLLLKGNWWMHWL